MVLLKREWHPYKAKGLMCSTSFIMKEAMTAYDPVDEFDYSYQGAANRPPLFIAYRSNLVYYNRLRLGNIRLCLFV